MAHTVLITGANRGIGQAIAAAFAAQGDNVATVDRHGQGMGIDSPSILALQGDVTDTDSINEAFDQAEAEFGPVDVLIANAGITRDKALLRMTDQDFAAVAHTNLAGTFRQVRRAAKSMIRAKHGRMILIGSVIGALGGAGQTNYAATKAGLVGIARSVTRELGARGITANVIAPGFIQTDMTAALPEETQQRYQNQIPAGHFGLVDDVAATALFLASDQAGYISGAVIPVDGGLAMGL